MRDRLSFAVTGLGTLWLRKLFTLPAMSNELQDKTNKTAATIGTQSLHYKSFLVRLWCEHEAAPWRASVTHITTDETQIFSNVEALLIFLHEQATTGTINDESRLACGSKLV